MTWLVEHAPAKINLTLAVRGRRPDGYHELDSFVTFARAAGDRLSLLPGGPFELETDGPFASAITEDNLIAKAVRLALEADPGLTLGRFRLAKHLPVAAGIGGGTSDAAAALRLIARANPARAASIDWRDIARRVGADGPVCLEARAARLSGLGERVEPLGSLPPVDCVLVNPGVPLATPPVFRALAAPAFDGAPLQPWPHLATTDDLLAHVRAGRNDLEPAAISLCPVIADVLAALHACPGVEVARMSGSGSTCFALFRVRADNKAAAALSAAHPDWWTVTTSLC
jgi:4-diphosphocytidyl-2-C-methyl-D-erythritol kinase